MKPIEMFTGYGNYASNCTCLGQKDGQKDRSRQPRGTDGLLPDPASPAAASPGSCYAGALADVSCDRASQQVFQLPVSNLGF